MRSRFHANAALRMALVDLAHACPADDRRRVQKTKALQEEAPDEVAARLARLFGERVAGG
jgi:hypothetical protein